MKKKKIVHFTNLSSHIKSKKFDDFFLGKWCNLYSKNDKLFLHYKFKEKKNFKKIQENNLFFLSRALNDYHKTNYSKNFWKILLYPWIYYFSYILSDRFDVIKKLKKIDNIDNFLVTDDKPNIIYEDFLHHVSNYQTDIFNNNIFKDLINLELPLKYGTKISGHICQGHIDTVAKVLSIKKIDKSYLLNFEIPKKEKKHLIEKASICVNGISLTISKVSMVGFQVWVIPHTYKETNLSILKKNQSVNIEIDILSKYIRNYFNDKK